MNKKFNINIDKNLKTVPTDFSWQFGIGNDHAFQVLRTDVCEHLKLAHDMLGFKYVRFHGIFNDDMRIIQSFADQKSFGVLPKADKITEVSFWRVATVLDNVLKCGLKPFVELSFMPKALAGGETQGLAYVNNITMPKKLEKWAEFIKSFIDFAICRYGKEEVESWYFEVWNEPDLTVFFDGTKEDYFALYDATAKTIKEINKNLRVGGPSTSACKWLQDFKDHCEANSVPYDFISTHHYPGDAFGNILSEIAPSKLRDTAINCAEKGVDLGDTMTALFFDPTAYGNWKKGTFAKMDEEARRIAGDKPLFISEWNSMAVYAAPVHDEKYSAAFVIKSVMDVRNTTDGYMFWCCSDIFEEMYDLGKPFHGSFGIINNAGIPKPNFWAFKLLSQLLPNRLDLPITNDDVEYSVFTDGKKFQILVYAQNFDCLAKNSFDIELSLAFDSKEVTKQVIDDKHCNPKDEWLRMGKPDLLTPNQIKEIKNTTKLTAENQTFKVFGGKTLLHFSMSTNDVILFEFE